MIKIAPGYKTPIFNGFGDSLSVQTESALQGFNRSDISPAVSHAVVYGGIPLCAWVAVTGRGISSFAVGALGLALLYLHLTGGLSPVASES